MNFQTSDGKILYGGVVIVDTSNIENIIDYGGMLYELSKSGFRDGEVYQIENAGNLIMYRGVYKRCKNILEKFGVKNLS
jgi:hypothetical protein